MEDGSLNPGSDEVSDAEGEPMTSVVPWKCHRYWSEDSDSSKKQRPVSIPSFDPASLVEAKEGPGCIQKPWILGNLSPVSRVGSSTNPQVLAQFLSRVSFRGSPTKRSLALTGS